MKKVDQLDTYPLLEHSLQGRNNVLALHTVDIESLGPSLQDTVVNVFLSGGVRKGETEGQLGQVLILVVELNELLQAVGNVLPQLLGSTGPQLIGHLVFGLCDFKGTLGVCQGNFANAQVGTTHIKGEEGALLFTVGESQDPGNIHRLFIEVY